MDKMDWLDRALYRLPPDVPADDLACRVFHFVQTRHCRKSFVRFGLSLILAAGGFWLSSPLIFTLPDSVNLPDSGLAVLWNWVQVAVSDFGTFLTSIWNGFTGLQSGIAAPITTSVWLGLAILALSALLAVSQMLPQNTGLVREGV